MNHKENNQRLTISFNIILFLYICLAYIAEYLFSPESADKTPLDPLFEQSPILAILIALIFAGVLIIAGTQLLKVFWNRFVSDILNIRRITFHESMAIFLIIGVIFS